MTALPRHLLSASLALLLFSFSQSQAQTEILENDNFSDGGESWALQSPRNAVSSKSIVEQDGQQILCVEVEKEDENPADVRIQKLFGGLVKDKLYRVTFQVKAEEPAKIIAYVYPRSQTSKVLWRTEISADPEWREYAFEFKGQESADNCVLGFSNLGKLGTKYYFKDINLTEG